MEWDWEDISNFLLRQWKGPGDQGLPQLMSEQGLALHHRCSSTDLQYWSQLLVLLLLLIHMLVRDWLLCLL